MNKKALSKQQKYQLVREDYDGTVTYYHARYNTTEEFRTQIADFLTSLPKHAVVLDSGSGPGKEANMIAQTVQKVVALDLSARMLEKVKATNPLIETVHANMKEIPLANTSFDAIWCSRAIIHIPQEDLAQTVTEFHRLLKPGGMLGLIFRIPDEGVVLKEEFLPETAPHSEGLVYYRNLYSDAYMSEVLTRVGFVIEKKEPGLSIDNEVNLYIRTRKEK